MGLPPVKFIVIAGLIMLLAVWNHFREADQRQLLLAEGFVVTSELDGSPAILISEVRQQLAVLYPDGFVRTSFDQVAGIDMTFQLNSQQERMNHQLVITLKDAAETRWRIHFPNDGLLETAKSSLDRLIQN
ncbi:hypothetical protein [Aliamphritea ceti]|uniref:hypothetical protein n=1 Tax=Aliamphritea ceti TaxID=1524258 RepID=UPI0021C46347|nr:hypothetical protein [Aliamphritea ceti]